MNRWEGMISPRFTRTESTFVRSVPEKNAIQQWDAVLPEAACEHDLEIVLG